MPDEKSVSHSSPPGPQVPFLKASSISFWGQKIKLHNVEFWNFVNTQKIDFRILKLFREGSPRGGHRAQKSAEPTVFGSRRMI